ncbi:MAG: hypothetical protein RMJ98_19605 [Myxococcales bacterium]|nr:hypothetical protein [Polyangiaceae bacterium]MDW8251506.1 hypothetical protein [Myxococcales bacterium]
MSARLLSPFFLLVHLLLALLAWSTEVRAESAFLRQGREQEVLALFAPYVLGGPVSGGFTLWDVSIEPTRILVTLKGPAGRSERLALVHPADESAPADAPRTANFRVILPEALDSEGRAAAEALLMAVMHNDHQALWDAPAPAFSPGKRHLTRLSARVVNRWQRIDGIALLLVLWLLAGLLAGRALARQPRWMLPTLVLIVLGGAWVRWFLAPASFLGAWPWSRLWPNISQVADGPLMAWITGRFGSVYLTDVIVYTNFTYAVLMPLVMFSHGSFLARDARVGLLAAFFVACLPQHIRFSRAEDTFVPSLVLTSLAFASLHAWLRDPSQPVRLLSFLSLPPLLFLSFTLRPLNILFLVVYLVALVTLYPEVAPRHRRRLAALAIVVAGLLALPGYLASNEQAIRSILSDLSWLWLVPKVLLHPSFFVLSDPRVTPPLLFLLAIMGVRILWSSEDRRTVLFLLGWILLFVVGHSTVVQESMQPRYMMHLVVPFLLLASLAGVRWFEGAGPGRWWLAAVGLLVLSLSPWMYRSFLQDLSFTEMQEHAFVLRVREQIPEGCAVIEYAGEDPWAADLRFQRAGERVGPRRSHRFLSVPVFASGVIPLVPTMPTLERIQKSPPACLYVYQGLSCWLSERPDPCRNLLQSLSFQEIARQELPMKLYDRANIHPSRRDEPSVTLILGRVINLP